MKVLGEVGFDQTVTEIKKLRSKVSELQQIIDNSEIGMGYIDCTYAEALELANNAQLNAGYRYRINDYEPCVRESKLYKYMPSDNVKKIYIFLTALSDSEFDINCTIQLETKNQGIVEVNGQYCFDNYISAAAIDALEMTWVDRKNHKGCIRQITTPMGVLPFDFYQIGIRQPKTPIIVNEDHSWAIPVGIWSPVGYIVEKDNKRYLIGLQSANNNELFRNAQPGGYISQFDLGKIKTHDYFYYDCDGCAAVPKDNPFNPNIPTNVNVGDNIADWFVGNHIGYARSKNGSKTIYLEQGMYQKIGESVCYLGDWKTWNNGDEITDLPTIGDFYIKPSEPNCLRQLGAENESFIKFNKDVTYEDPFSILNITKLTYKSARYLYIGAHGQTFVKVKKDSKDNVIDWVGLWTTHEPSVNFACYDGVWYAVNTTIKEVSPDFDNILSYINDATVSHVITDASEIDNYYWYLNGSLLKMNSKQQTTISELNTIVTSVTPSTKTPNPIKYDTKVDFVKLMELVPYGSEVPYADALATVKYPTSRINRAHLDLYLPTCIKDMTGYWPHCEQYVRDYVGLDIQTNEFYNPESGSCEIRINDNIMNVHGIDFAQKIQEWVGQENINTLNINAFRIYQNLIVHDIETAIPFHANLPRNTKWDIEIYIPFTGKRFSDTMNRDNPDNGKMMTGYSALKPEFGKLMNTFDGESLPDLYNFDGQAMSTAGEMFQGIQHSMYAKFPLTITCYDVEHRDDKDYRPKVFSTEVIFQITHPKWY